MNRRNVRRPLGGDSQDTPNKRSNKQDRSRWLFWAGASAWSRPSSAGGGKKNPNLATGEIEIKADKLTIFSRAETPPFEITDQTLAGESVRLKHRYLDLRRPGVHSAGHAIRLRSKVNAAARRVLGDRDFVEIETPTLTRSTPEGARDFLVPARLAPGSWYALPQSPQLFKQLLMVAGMERYYQIARCYRDEDFRADRQPEFTQLDIEMSFVDQDDVIALGERIVAALWRDLAGHEITLKFVNTSTKGHDFTAPEFFKSSKIVAGAVDKDGKVDLHGSETKSVTLIPAAGTYNAHCGRFLHSSFGMHTTVVVR